jgi:hypothetical protein
MEEEKKENIEQRSIPFIELTWEDNKDLLDLASQESFTSFILEESLVAIIDALENSKSKAELFNIFNLSVIIEIEKSQFKTVINKINDMFINNEQYEKCAKLKNIIKKYKL